MEKEKLKLVPKQSTVNKLLLFSRSLSSIPTKHLDHKVTYSFN